MLLTSVAAYAATEAEVSAITDGTAKSEVHEIIGAPDSADEYGYKDMYNLPDGKRAILRYFDGVFDNGYILVD